MKTRDGRLTVIAGKSRSGKTAWLLREIKARKFKRVIAWDPEDQWSQVPGFRRFTSLAELTKHLGASGKFAFVPAGESDELKRQFDRFCWVAFSWVDIVGDVAIIQEELADVTTPSKAPGNHGILIRRGLKRGAWIYPISQRWAEADKTALGNASAFVCCMMHPPDVEYMAKKTGIPAPELAEVRRTETETHITCMYIHKDSDSGKIERGKMTFRK